MSASGTDWEPVLARLYRARHATARALALLDKSLEAVCEGENDEVLLAPVKDARHRLAQALSVVEQLTRDQL